VIGGHIRHVHCVMALTVRQWAVSQAVHTMAPNLSSSAVSFTPSPITSSQH